MAPFFLSISIMRIDRKLKTIYTDGSVIRSRSGMPFEKKNTLKQRTKILNQREEAERVVYCLGGNEVV